MSSSSSTALTPAERLRALAAEMRAAGVDSLIVPSDDAHHSEYTALCDQRRAWLSGFTGSAGTAVVRLLDAADDAAAAPDARGALWTDGRYHLQAEAQLDDTVWTLMREAQGANVPTVPAWLLAHACRRTGVDPRVLPLATARDYAAALAGGGGALVAVDTPHNLVDACWARERDDSPAARPPPPAGEIFAQPLSLAGTSSVAKLRALRVAMREARVGAAIVSELPECAWLFNMRGSDTPCNPVAFAYAIVEHERTSLFIARARLSAELRARLADEHVDVHEYTEFYAHLRRMVDERKSGAAAAASSSSSDDGGSDGDARPFRFWLQDQGNWAIYSALPEHMRALCSSYRWPIATMRAVKNDVELAGTIAAHRRDGAALTAFFAWLEAQLLGERCTTLTEATIADRLAEFRARQPHFVSLSFDTIAGSGANGAIIHYKPEHGRDAAVLPGVMLLVDSGAQYRDGTTDITRTVLFGGDGPSEHQRRCFTRVLQGHIALARVHFPVGRTGYQLDSLARAPLWSDGLDYAHGTGHGVGSFLCVHEGPHGIGYRQGHNVVALADGMLSSNEPGYYEAGEFGIRIENIVHCRTSPRNARMLCFDTISLAPIQRSLIDAALLSPEDRTWLNDYHARVAEQLAPLLADDARALDYLKRETAPI